MTVSECEKARKELEEYLHNELCKEDAADVREHLDGCADCAQEYRVGQVLTEVIQRGSKESAPEELRNQVLLKLRNLHQNSH